MKKHKHSSVSKEELLHDRLRHATFAYLNEAAARDVARREFADFDIVILHSPHDGNPSVRGHRMDYWIDEPGMIRSWERIVFEGLGKNA